MLSMYPACFYKEKDGQYSVIFPDLNVSTCGENLEDAVRMAVDCLAGWLYTAKIDKEEIPEPSDFTKINPDEYYDDYEKAFVKSFLLTLMSTQRSISINLSKQRSQYPNG